MIKTWLTHGVCMAYLRHFSGKLILNFDAQYAIFGRKFFGAKNDDLSEFQIT
ncbi:hypothetical protein GNF11_34530 [Nostoc sp. UCD122]|nr:hypothetical protein [Nostoc sp. UCD122]